MILGSIYWIWNKQLIIKKKWEKPMKKQLKMYHHPKKKDFGEDIFIYGTRTLYLKNSNAMTLWKVLYIFKNIMFY